jgi:menaquinone-dependent protoporphyrinogen IX oxidase
MRNVLLAYATRNGSTQQVAESAAASRREAGAQVTARETAAPVARPPDPRPAPGRAEPCRQRPDQA